MSIESAQAPIAITPLPLRRRSPRLSIEQRQLAKEMLPFHQRLAKSSSFRRLARAEDIYVRVAINTADLLPLTAPSLSFEDLRSLVLQETTEIFSPPTIQAKYGISPERLEKQLQRIEHIDRRWRDVFHAMYETKLGNSLGISHTSEMSWVHHLIDTHGGKGTAEEILAALPLQYFPAGTTDKERMTQITQAMQSAEGLLRI